MSDQTASSQGMSLFEECMEVLQQELELASRWKRPVLLLAAYGSEYIREDSVSLLENFLMDRGQTIVWIHAE